MDSNGTELNTALVLLWRSFSELDSKSMEFEGVLNKTFRWKDSTKEIIGIIIDIVGIVVIYDWR